MTRTPRLKSDGATPREIAFLTNQLLLGRINTTGQVTLKIGQSMTTVERPYIAASSVMMLFPTTANAAAATPTTWTQSRSGAVDLHHISNGLTDRTFNFAIVGG
jgi:hypothetical protein